MFSNSYPHPLHFYHKSISFLAFVMPRHERVNNKKLCQNTARSFKKYLGVYHPDPGL